MPPRISRSSLSESKTKGPAKKNKSKKRTLNAFSIASIQNPETHKLRRNRLGEAAEDDQPQRKKARKEEDSEDEEDEEDGPSRQNKKALKGRYDELDLSEGSDSEGNRWKTGVVDDDDDESLDSDEAFGSSDEEKFSGFTFRGSSGGKGKKAAQKKKKIAPKRELEGDLDLDEEESEPEDEDEDDLGEDAIDLATMLDQYQPSDEEDQDNDDKRSSNQDDEESGDEASSESSMSDLEEDGNNEDKLSRLQDLVSKLHPKSKEEKSRLREKDPHEAREPSTSGMVSSEKFDIKDILASTSDPQLKAISKQVGNIPKQPKKDPKLAASLPKRQKDKLDRIAANEQTKKTLDRWNDTVKQNRQAEHLSFPLADPDTAKPFGSKHLLPTSQTAPMNDLESAIQNIMQESGLITGNQNEEEERILGFEELRTNKMPIEEVQARRAELRKARDLMFREEIRAKRIKKIKSKSYRRVHRKEREKLAAMERDAFAEGGEEEMDEEERETADRKRAEERMGAKHRDSKWAKAIKKSGRSVWDENAKSGVSEMARRNEELRRRIEGKEVRDEDASADDAISSSEDSEDDSDVDDETEEFRRLQRKLSKLDGPELEDSGSGLHQMKFMKEAEARRTAQNKDDIARMRRELAGEESEEVEEDTTIGRKLFGPTTASIPVPVSIVQNEFEEAFGSDDEERQEIISKAVVPTVSAIEANYQLPRNTITTSKKPAPQELSRPRANGKPKQPGKVIGAVDKKSSKTPNAGPELLPGEKHSQPDADGWVTVQYDNEPSEGEEEDEVLPVTDSGLVDQAEILRRAFAGDDVEEAFEDEKKATVLDEDDKIVDDTLPGWGAWVGEGVSARDKKRNTGRWLRKVEGIKADDRKDKKLKHVIINQKRVKKNVGYLATTLPFPFTNRAEYERSIRMPIGSEWNVKEVFQESTKPRVLVKAGSIIKPMDKPMA
ncbi:Utp14-domain-containing protein [Venturia nashicola]|uniref:Utp14-domain-containing protein n=1 Tax=Venturia nashicola TaxID=86259 RepID=A0A4Z1P2H9_9PEZI|nr:Utp14-domain-containing protein [Venturia nashicola]